MRSRILGSIILFFFVVLVVGLFYSQVLKYDVYRELSEKNRIRVLPLEAPRGKIYDRNGNLLVSNRISFDVEVVYQEIGDKEALTETLSEILEIDKSRISKKVDEARKNPFIPFKVVEDIGKDKAIRLEEVSIDLPGVIVTTRPLRRYAYDKALSHIVGYLGKISEEELKRYSSYGYSIQDYVGKDGIERNYNEYLRGVHGGLQTEVDSRGRLIRTLAIKEPIPGKNLYLSIDGKLQAFCDSLMEDKKGAIVVMNPSTGEILVMVSHPNFDPSVFITPGHSREVIELLNSKTYPLLNRSISSSYPPGSVFKIVVALGGLDSKSFDKKRNLFCGGSYRVGNRVFNCWRKEGHGTQDIIAAIKQSCNAFFYQLGLLLGVDEIANYAFMLGFGKITGVDLPGESSGLVPSSSWKRRKLNEPWYKGETANYAIGQGYLLVTPIQIAQLLGITANKGKIVEPFIVDKIEDIRIHHAQPREVGLDEDALEVVREGLKAVVNGERGTGYYARSKEVVISGKTGTAQNPRGISHAWFAGFAPYEDPKLCIVVFLEHGGKGGLAPARFSKKIIEEAKKLNLL